MKKMVVILIAIIVLTLTSVSIASSEIGNKEDELQKIENDIKSLDNEIRNKETGKKQVEKDINSLNNNIRDLSNEISDLDDEIDLLEYDIDQLEIELTDTQVSLEDSEEFFYQRLRVIYKSRNIGYFEIIFGAKDFEDLLTRMDMFKMLVKHDKILMQDLSDDIKTLEDIKNNLLEKKNELKNSKLDLNNIQDSLDVQIDTLGDKKKQLIKDLEALESQVDRLNNDADKLTKIIENLKLQSKYVGGEMAWPTPGIYRITSPFGYRIHPILNIKKLHTGIDIGVPQGTRVVAAQDGIIIYSDWYGGYGMIIMIDHGGGIVTLYGHNSKLIARVGQVVKKGDPISLSGTTGLSTGPHLHFEVRVDGKYVDPLTFVTAN